MSFQPFVVQCLTCSSRLRVTDPSVVGTIVTCPKCHSMLQIDEPGDQGMDSPVDQVAEHGSQSDSHRPQVMVGDSNVDSQAITNDAIAPPDLSAPSDSPTPHGFAGDHSVHIDPSGVAETPAPLVPPEWQSDRVRKTRQVAAVAALAVLGLISAVIVFGWFVRSLGSSDDPVIAQQSETSNDDAVDDRDAGGTDATSQRNNDQTPSSQSIDGTQPDRPTDSEVAEDIASVTDSTASPAEDGNDVPDDVSTEPAQTDQGNHVSLSSDPSSGVIPTDLLPQSPLDDPSESPRELTGDPTVASSDATTPSASDSMMDLPPGLQQFVPFLVDEGLTAEPNLAAPPTMDELEIEAAAEDRDRPVVNEPTRTLNLKADLGIQLALDSDGYPLADLVLLVGQITGVPIQIDWVSFDLAGVDVAAPVTTQKGWQTARQLLDRTAAAMGAELREEPALVILTLTDATFEQFAQPILSTDDFGEGKETAIATLDAFFNGEDIGQDRKQQQLAALATDALRRMRGMPVKVDDARFHHWAGSTADVVEWPSIVDGRPIAQPDAPLTLAALLRRLARSNGATCVVNWYDVTGRGAGPEQLVFPKSTNDAASMLHTALEPWALQVRRVDDRHWWVGTEPTYDRLTAVVWTQPLGDGRDAFEKQVRRIMQGATSDSFRIAIDEPSDRALLLLPRFIVRQLTKITSQVAAR